jgi:hypothetical protein
MENALFAFEDRDAGRRAAQRLIEKGMSREAVQVHARPATPTEEMSRSVDEQVTGGLVQNLRDLFQGVMEWGASPHDASAYEETVRRGGTVVAVDADTEAERTMAEEVMRAAGCAAHTDWKPPTEA